MPIMKTQQTSIVMILGASGRLGAELQQQFSAKGFSVLSQSLRHWKRGDVGNLPKVKVDIVINAANPVYTDWQRDALALCQAAIDIATHYQATLIFPGNVYNFGENMPAQLYPNTVHAAKTHKGQIRIKQEAMLRDAARSGLQCIVIRAGDFFGSGTGVWFDLVIAKKLAKNQVTYPGPTDKAHAWAYLPDLAAYFVQVASLRHSLGSLATIHFEGHTLTGQQLIDALSDLKKTRLAVKKFPWAIVKALKLFVPMWAAAAEMEYLWRVPHSIISDKSNALLTPDQQTPLREALRLAINL
jgi:nucleoside-diphosphate-sugar epimerase